MPTLVLDYIGENKEGDTLFDYKEIMSEVSARSITKIIKYIGDNWGEMKIVSLQYFQLENEIHISFENGGKILFTLKDFSKQDINGTENIFLKNGKYYLLSALTFTVICSQGSLIFGI